MYSMDDILDAEERGRAKGRDELVRVLSLMISDAKGISISETGFPSVKAKARGVELGLRAALSLLLEVSPILWYTRNGYGVYSDRSVAAHQQAVAQRFAGGPDGVE